MTQEKIQIKVTIANRIYPLTIHAQEEEGVRKAEKMINDKMREYEKSFAVNDKVDLLAMMSLHFVTELISKEKRLMNQTEHDADVISEIDSNVSDYLRQLNVL